MEVTITYVVHNCFCLVAGHRAVVFDYPRPEHRTPGAQDAVRVALAGRDAVVFFSHSHGDHCSADVALAASEAASVRYVLSYDVPDMVPELDLPGAVVVEPGDGPAGGVPGPVYALDEGLSVSALESNDLGVAFMIRMDGLKIYYGGDLAQWVWPEMDAASAAFTRRFFSRSLDTVRAFAPDVAFSDCDARLPQWSGAEQFARTVRPGVFVPMHDFGEPAKVAAYARTLDVAGTRIVTFGKTGDEVSVEL